MSLERKIILALLFGIAFCWFVGNGCSLEKPAPLSNRPVLKWIAKAAKTLLWVAVFVEPAPPEEPEHDRTMHHEDEVGADGHPLVHHARGW
jgi:hypothetical protein